MASQQRTDRIRIETRILAAVIVPILLLAFIILYIFPDSNGERFAWFVKPRMSAMMLGAVYLTGVFFFAPVLFAQRWSQVRIGFIPVATFATLMGIATLLHWDKFNHHHVAFWLWSLLYATTPFIVPLVWHRNQAIASGVPLVAEQKIPMVANVFIGLVGVSGALACLLLFAQPELMIRIWPWPLTQLTARVMGAQFALFGVFALMVLGDRQWDSVRLPFRLQLASPIFFLGATLVSRHDFDWANPLAWIFVFNIVFLFVLGIPILYFLMESQRGRLAK